MRTGKAFQKLINETNECYSRIRAAFIVETSAKVDIQAFGQHGTVMGKARKGPVDYLGSVKGLGIAFDAKSTKGKSMPLKNIHRHQITFLRKWTESGQGVAFLLVEFSSLERYFVLPWKALEAIWGAYDDGDGPASCSLAYFEKHGHEIKRIESFLDYLLPIVQWQAA